MSSVVELDPQIQVWQEAADGDVCGDLVFSVRAADALRIAVVDGCGHGQKARDLARAFRDVAAADLHGPITEASWRRWNQGLLATLRCGQFVAATLVEVFEGGARVRIWNAGNPAPIVAQRDGRPPVTHVVFGLPVGAVDDELYTPPMPSDLELSAEDTLLVFSDGLTDQRKGDERFADSAMNQGLSTLTTCVLASVRRATTEFLAGAALIDDLTVVAIRAAAVSVSDPAPSERAA